jgi:hypothetical protein
MKNSNIQKAQNETAQKSQSISLMVLIDCETNHETKEVAQFVAIANTTETVNQQAGKIFTAARVAARNAIQSGYKVKELKKVKDSEDSQVIARKVRESDFRITIALNYSTDDEQILGKIVSLPFAFTDGQKVRKSAIDFINALLSAPIDRAHDELIESSLFTDNLKVKEVPTVTKDGKQTVRKVADVPQLADFRRFLDSPLSIALN